MASLKDVSKDIQNDLSKLSKVGRVIGADLHTLTLDRIFSDGIASNGSKLGTYSPTTISLKKSAGHFTSINVNLRNTDKLASSYTFDVKGNDVNLGFQAISRGDGSTNKEIMAKLEKQYGTIFALTSQETSEIDEIISDYLDKVIT